MFWRMAGLSTASPVETILDKENFTLEELLDEDEIIQECKSLNGRLINFLRERDQVEQLIRYIVEEAPEDAERRRTFKFPFIACEIFTCEVDVILKTLVENEELMDLLFSFLSPERSHSTLLAGYFSKVVICLLVRKTVPFMRYVQAHQEIFKQLVDLIGITSIMEVLIRLIGADEHMYSNHTEVLQWLEDTDILELILDKFSSSDSPEVHTNAAETLCAITCYAPPGLSAKISSPSFIRRLFQHALEDSRPRSVLVNSLSICISLLDPKRLMLGSYHMYNRQMAQGSNTTAKPETIEGMLEKLGDLLKLLDVSSGESVLVTTFGKLQPPLGKHRLKIVEFIAVLLATGSEAAEKEVIQLGAIKRVLELFFEYPYHNFMHHHVENIIIVCLENKNAPLVDHLLHDCDLMGRILEVEKNSTLTTDPNKPTVPADGRTPPRIGNIGHLTCISNKLVQLGNNNSEIQSLLQGNSEWTDWHTNVLLKRNAVENVYQWACGDSDDDDYQDRDFDVATLANNLSQAFRYGIYNNDEIDEGHGSLDRDDEDVYFDDESAEVVISSLRLGDDQDSGSLFTNSNWFAFEDDRIANERSSSSLASPSPNIGEIGVINSGGDDEVIVGGDDDLEDTATSADPVKHPEEANVDTHSESRKRTALGDSDKPAEWVEWRETDDAGDPSEADKPPVLPNGEPEVEVADKGGDVGPITTEPSALSKAGISNSEADTGEALDAVEDKPSSAPDLSVPGVVDPCLKPIAGGIVDAEVEEKSTVRAAEHEKKDAVEKQDAS
ncbi:SIT4 phosphatase-associated protein family [Dillenia turbinata]|uniref:SIT4 phosphatase-associated protein family n=1 Tax=Dillenia turbinata TaxID=194707 RepID=A0AAN8VRI2_9MAGN